MAHSTNIISSIKLPNGTAYEIHDAQAIHSAEELGLSSALRFMGTNAAVANLPTTGNKVGDVWHVTADASEYVWTSELKWEALGSVHDAASSTHTHTVTVTGANEESSVTGEVTVPSVSKTQKYLSATAGVPKINLTTTDITASASGTAVAADGTANAITGFGTHTTDTALGAGATFKVSGGAASTSKMVTTTIKNPTVTAVTIPNVVGNVPVKASHVSSAGSKTNGTAASWSAKVTNGVLEFSWSANTPTAVTLPTFTEVDATNTALGDALSASSVTTSNVTVATGSLASNGSGSAVATGVGAVTVAVDNPDSVTAITALGTPTTAKALTGVKVTTQPTVTITNGSGVVTNAVAEAPSITLAANASTATGRIAYVSAVDIGATDASIKNGKAAAQKWTQTGGTTSTPK